MVTLNNVKEYVCNASAPYCDIIVVAYVETPQQSARLYDALDKFTKLPGSDEFRSAYIGTMIGERDNLRCVIIRMLNNDKSVVVRTVAEDRYLDGIKQRVGMLGIPACVTNGECDFDLDSFELVKVCREISVE